MADAKRTPIEPGVIERMAAGLRFAFTGDQSLYQGWFGPGTPPVPSAEPSTQGRQFDYQPNINTQYTPRSTEAVNFTTLRQLADGYDLLRLVIETKKDQLVKIKWTVKPKDEDQETDARCEEIQRFLESPDKINTWDQWFRAGMEDLLVIDAWTLLPRRTKGGKAYSLELIDGATVRPILGTDGRRPTEGPIYQQTLKGVVAAQYGHGELYYLPQNVRTSKMYGFGRVEQVLTTVNIAINRQLHQLSYYTKGSTPDLILSCPPEWGMDQVKKFATWWDSQLSGNSGARRKGIVVPAGVSSVDTKAGILKDDYDEWLARIICYSFSVAPQALIKEQNRSVAETQKTMAKEEGITPILEFVSNQLTRIICADLFGYDDLEIVPKDERTLDPLVQAQVDEIDLRAGVRSIEEARADRGLETQESDPTVVTGDGTEDMPLIVVGDNAPAQPSAVQDTALNGAQVASLMEIAASVSDGTLPKASAIAMIQAAFPSLRVEVVSAIINPIQVKEPTPEPDPQAPPPGTLPNKQGEDSNAPVVAQGGGAQKVEKRKKTSIKRERPSVLRLQKKIEGKIKAFLKSSAKKVASEVRAEKMLKMDIDEAKRLLESAGIDWMALGDDLEPLLQAIAQDGALAAMAQIGASIPDMLEQVNEAAVKWAQDRAAELVTGLEKTTVDALRGTITQGIEEGLSTGDLADKIMDAYGFSDERAEMIARTERGFADQQGNLIAYRESGMVVGKRSILGSEHDSEESSPDECDDAANMGIVKLDDDFGGLGDPPYHPNCVCAVEPILEGEEE